MDKMKTDTVRAEPKKSQKEVSSKAKKGKQVSITFNVTVPEHAIGQHASVFLVGSFQQFSPNLPDWDPRGLEMKKLSPGRWSITLMGQPHTEIEYKYTLGDWKRVEADAHGNDVPNRQTVVNAGTLEVQTIEDSVKSWRAA